MDPIRVLLRRVPSGDKNFSGFQNGELLPVNLRCQTPFSSQNKMERIKMDPNRVLLRRVPSGDKAFSSSDKYMSCVALWYPHTLISMVLSTCNFFTIGEWHRFW